jgi:tetratricopeptide (TPR) repeat protein
MLRSQPGEIFRRLTDRLGDPFDQVVLPSEDDSAQRNLVGTVRAIREFYSLRRRLFSGQGGLEGVRISRRVYDLMPHYGPFYDELIGRSLLYWRGVLRRNLDRDALAKEAESLCALVPEESPEWYPDREDSHHRTLWTEIGLAFVISGRVEEAKRYLLMGSPVKSPGAELVLDFVESLIGQGDHASATSLLARVSETDPVVQSSRYFELSGLAHLLAERYEEAEAALREAIRIDPQAWSAYTNLGTVCGKTGRLEEARQFWEKALEINPNDEFAAENLRRLDQH